MRLPARHKARGMESSSKISEDVRARERESVRNSCSRFPHARLLFLFSFFFAPFGQPLSAMPGRDVCATELFWHLVEEKGKVSPATGKQTFVQPFTMLEATWERFKTVRNATGRMQSDYTLAPTPAEADLDAMAEANIEPTCHPQVQCVVRPEMPARTLTRTRTHTRNTRTDTHAYTPRCSTTRVST